MKRSTLILGFALFVVAVTLAVTITVRNDPSRIAVRSDGTEVSSSGPVNRRYPAQRNSDSRKLRGDRLLGSADSRDYLQVSVPEESLAGLSSAEQTELLQRAEIVQREARQQLERMTEEFALTRAQRHKMFPVLARSTRHFDPAMQVGGAYLAAPDAGITGSEDVHDLLNPDQQESLENKELDRQLWWEDVFTRLDGELIDSTGGSPLQTAPAEGGAAPTEEPIPTERTAPTSRGGR